MNNSIVAVLSKSFNAEAADTRAVLGKYNAQLTVIIPGQSYHSVTGVAAKDEDAFVTEFRKLKGVESAYKKPPATPAG